MAEIQTSAPRALLTSGIKDSSATTIREALDLYRAHRRGLDTNTQTWALGFAIKFLKPRSLRFLITEFGRESVERVAPSVVGAGWVRSTQEDSEGALGVEEAERKTQEVLEVLVDAGWDVNRGEGGQSLDGGYLIYYLADSLNMIKWCLDHGAHVAYPDTDQAPTPPLLEVVAKTGNIETFKFLQAKGAPLGKRILHRAVEKAAYADTPQKLAAMLAMVKFLVEEVGLDVNGMDEEGRPNFYGPPINYASHASGGAEVVEYLLQKGADPRIKDRWGICDAFTFAKQGNPGVLEILNGWKEEQDSDMK